MLMRQHNRLLSVHNVIFLLGLYPQCEGAMPLILDFSHGSISSHVTLFTRC